MRIFFFFCTILLMSAVPLLSQTIVINEVLSSNTSSITDEDGDSSDWIELYNSGSFQVNLTGYGLSDERIQPYKWVFTETYLAPNEFLLVFASGKDRAGNHTNFRIDASGETLYLTKPGGEIPDSVALGEMATDVSYGRQLDGSDNWFYFKEPTPLRANDTQGFDSIILEVPTYSIKRGLYSSAVTLSLSTVIPGAVVYYTLDGTKPSALSSVYSTPLEISETSVVRARIMSSGVLSEVTRTHTYVINKQTNMAIVSITTNPANLWDSADGIYVNYNSNREIPIFLELFEPDGIEGYSKSAGMKIHGGWTREFPQKSFAIFARDKYGPSSIKHRLFPDLPFNEYESFILRNSGGDFEAAHIRDPLLQSLIKDLDIETQSYRPAVVYLNGEYWGILNIREKLNEHYIEAHHGISEVNLDMLENEQEVIHGDNIHYNAMLAYIASHDMSLEYSYEYLKSQLDMDNYLDYMVSQLYFANVDWPGWNLKYWRPRTSDGKWRWLVFDLDDGFKLGSTQNFGYTNMFDFATEPNGPEWPNPPWSTFLFRKLLENEAFKRDFINRYADYLNTIWQPGIVLAKIDNMLAELDPEMQFHLQRWGLSNVDWHFEIDELKSFAENRVEDVRTNILAEFSIPGPAQVALSITSPNGGSILLNKNISVRESLWNGQYFKGIPIELAAIPNPGYKFIEWTGDIADVSPTVTIPLNGDISATALFELDANSSGFVVINEINYHSAQYFDPKDWIEFYNDSDASFDLSNWSFRDGDESHNFVFPVGSILAAHKFLVLSSDTTEFSRFFPTVKPLVAEFDFNLDNAGESIYLINANGQIVDSLTYDDTAPWPLQADGIGATLALNSPELDNAIAQNWSASIKHGSPGSVNQIITAVEALAFESIPGSFLLEQNYPNPFNPATTISFQIPNRNHVRIKIFDIMGREVVTLIDKEFEAGIHHINWNASASNASGVYFYRLWTNGFSQIRRMLLLK